MRALKSYGIALISGLILGVFLGAHIGKTWVGGGAILWEMAASAGYSQFAFLQSDQADPDHARQALLGFTNFSKSMTKLHSGEGDKALLVDTGRAYLRLAAIEGLAGNSDLSHHYVLDAQQTFKNMGRNISEQDLDKQVAKMVASARPNRPPS